MEKIRYIVGVVSLNDKIACTPFPKKSIQMEVKTGFAVVKQKVDLIQLEVVFDFENNEFRAEAGDKIWIRGEFFNAVWAKEEFELEVEGEKKRFIFVPADAVLLQDSGE